MRIIIAVIIALALAVPCLAQTATQMPLTKDQIETQLKNVRIEKRYLELQVKEEQLQEALANMEKAKKKEEKKIEKAK